MIKIPLVAFNQNETPLCKSCKIKQRLVNITTKKYLPYSYNYLTDLHVLHSLIQINLHIYNM